ncbi:hypothetical protein [Flavobacterium sp. U410]
MKKIFSLSLMLVISSIIFSCSSDSGSSDMSQTQDLTTNVPNQIDYNPSSNGDNYVKEGTGNNVVLGTLFNSSLSGQLSVTLSGTDSGSVEVINGQLKTKSNVNFTTGSKSVNYTITQTGTSFSRTGNLTFDVYYNLDTYTCDNVIFIEWKVDGTQPTSPQSKSVDGVPYQYLIDDTMIFQMVSDRNYFLSTNSSTGWNSWTTYKVQSTGTFNSSLVYGVVNRNVFSKVIDLPSNPSVDNKRVYELDVTHIDPSNATFDSDVNTCSDPSDDNGIYDCTQI